MVLKYIVINIFQSKFESTQVGLYGRNKQSGHRSVDKYSLSELSSGDRLTMFLPQTQGTLLFRRIFVPCAYVCLFIYWQHLLMCEK